MKLYFIGSLRNPEIPKIAEKLRKNTGHEIFDDWAAAGPEADDYWRDYEKARGHSYKEALAGHAAQHVFQFDKSHLDTSDGAILAWPAGKSAHLELGYIIGQGKPGWVLLDGEPERFDVMLNFATGVFTSVEALSEELNKQKVIDPNKKFPCNFKIVERRYGPFPVDPNYKVEKIDH